MVALALIPEAIAFCIIAGVDPKVGLYASFCIAVIASIFGGRPGMISAATGAMALLMVTLVKAHGLPYLLAATLLTSVFKLLAGALKASSVMRFVSKSVMSGFVNALAILIFMAQLPEFKGAGWMMYAMVAGSLAIIYLLPRLTKAVPSPLVAIVVMTGLAIALKLDVRRVGDLGSLPDSLPFFLWPGVPLNLDTLRIILPYSAGLAVVGLLESWMTAQIADDLTDTASDKNRESTGQGPGNIVAGLFGGMAGCAMIGQSVINVKSGGRGRLSTFTVGVVLLLLIVAGNQWVKQIPMPALVAVMLMVSIGTFSWASFRNMRLHPGSSSMVILATVTVVVATHNLAIGVRVLHLREAHREPSHGTYLTGAIGFDASGELTESLVKFEESRARMARLQGKAILDGQPLSGSPGIVGEERELILEPMESHPEMETEHGSEEILPEDLPLFLDAMLISRP